MKKFIHDTYKNISESILPALSTSQFKEKGVLTPEEYVIAGDYLVQTCPTWSWDGGDLEKRRSFLPTDKQYLITRNVPCLQRAIAIENYANTTPTFPQEEVEEGEWISTTLPHTHPAATDRDIDEEGFERLPSSRHKRGPIPTIKGSDDEDEDHEEKGTNDYTSHKDVSHGKEEEGSEWNKEQKKEIPDISDLQLDGDGDMDDAVAPPSFLPSATKPSTLPSLHQQGPSGVLQTRTYDILISYDKHYQVPRVWLIGYSEDRTPLTHDQIMEDIINDYYTHRDRKTVGVEDHPHKVGGGRVVSIHPCRHASVMKKLTGVVTSEQDGDQEFQVDQYVALLLY